MKLFISAVLAALTFLSCSHYNEKKAADIQLIDLPSIETIEEMSSGKEFERQPEIRDNISQQKAPLSVTQNWERQIIRQASLHIRVQDFRLAHAGIYQLVENAGGYVADDAEMQLGNRIKSEMTIKVPQEKFDWLIARLGETGDSLLQKNVTSEDFSAEYVDTKARIAAREKVRDKYYEFLQKAKNIDEVLKVQKEIGLMQEEIEAANGRVAYIRQQTSFSTIRLSFFQPLDRVIDEPAPPGFGQKIIHSIKDGWKMIELVLIGLITVWPLWTLGLLTLYVVKSKKKVGKAAKAGNG
ncbi:MAG: DUF4349 domain-containing protein [Chitinophagaceae bacterium]|nr:DUF4349 domain-containing protein [Chitinophagaceae bacterium]MCW5927418.1 DUF4349 domain-containing protein [Chitinophagaceae bacterium]